MDNVSRRSFIKTMASLPIVCSFTWAEDIPREIKIVRMVGFNVESLRIKYIGKNAMFDDHGEVAGDELVRIYTNKGYEGIGRFGLWRGERILPYLLGKNPLDFLKLDKNRIVSPIQQYTSALWDLVGKILNKPVYELLGGKGPVRVPAYDSTIYFSDLLPEYASNYTDRFKEEIDNGLEAGYRAFKIKIGRGNLWMPIEEGYQRDVEVIRIIRNHAGPDITIGVDTNNSYGVERAKRFLKDISDLNLAFIEEPFPETVDECLEFKDYILENGWRTLLADGESHSEPNTLKCFIDTKAIDVLQGDMGRFGIDGIFQEATWAQQQNLLVAPHNWGSLVATYEMAQVGRAIPNFYYAEHDRAANNIIIADGYKMHDGGLSVPDSPGFGLLINEKEFANIKPVFDIKT